MNRWAMASMANWQCHNHRVFPPFTPWFMLRVTSGNDSLRGVYKATNRTGGGHIVGIKAIKNKVVLVHEIPTNIGGITSIIYITNIQVVLVHGMFDMLYKYQKYQNHHGHFVGYTMGYVQQKKNHVFLWDSPNCIVTHGVYPLVNVYIAMENGPSIDDFPIFSN